MMEFENSKMFGQHYYHGRNQFSMNLLTYLLTYNLTSISGPNNARART